MKSRTLSTSVELQRTLRVLVRPTLQKRGRPAENALRTCAASEEIQGALPLVGTVTALNRRGERRRRAGRGCGPSRNGEDETDDVIAWSEGIAEGIPGVDRQIEGVDGEHRVQGEGGVR